MTLPVTIYTKQDFYLLSALDKVIQELKASGLIEFWNLLDTDQSFLKSYEKKTPMSLQLKHFTGGFYIYFFGLFFSFLILVFESMFIHF